MTPLRLTLKNFIGIRDGMGRDEFTLDLTEHPGELVALTGPNGMGKTTILDNLHPYRIMPSRATSYSTNAFSYFDHTVGDAKKELIWQYGGKVYQSIILIKGSGKSKKQECYLQRRDEAGDWQPVEFPGGLFSDGKTKTYDQCVERILGSPELFFTAAFACQSRKSLADYANADIKLLMADLLGLDALQQLSENANTVVRGAKLKLEGLRSEISRADQIKADMERATQDLDGVLDQMNTMVDRRDAETDVLNTAKQRLTEAQSANANQAETLRRRESLGQQIANAEQRKITVQIDIEKDFAEKRADQERRITENRAAIEKQQAAITTANTRIEKHRALLQQKADIEKAASALQDIDRQIADLNKNIENKDIRAGQLNQLARELAEANANMQRIQAEGRAARDEVDGLQGRCQLIDEVPCQGTDLQGRCKLLAEANAAKDALPAKEQLLENRRKERDELQPVIDRLQQETAGLDAINAELKTAKTTLAGLQADYRRQSELAAKADQVKDAEEQLAKELEQIAGMETELADMEGRTADLNEGLASLAEQQSERVAAAHRPIDQDIAALQKELSALPPTNDDELKAAQQEATEAERQLEATVQQLTEHQSRVATLKERIAQYDQQLQAMESAVQRARGLENEIAHWTLLSKALGRDGIIALCIDDAGPAISRLANDILVSCYGPRFTVSIQTQQETASGKLNEGFDIRVLDAEHNSEKSIRDVSGGQRIWINEAMTRAIALYQAESANRAYECLFSDESDGALDVEKKRQFLDMKRKVLKLGGYRREIFISHTPELCELADAQINLETLSREAA